MGCSCHAQRTRARAPIAVLFCAAPCTALPGAGAARHCHCPLPPPPPTRCTTAQVGATVREKIIPSAVDVYVGEEGMDFGYHGGDDDEEGE